MFFFVFLCTTSYTEWFELWFSRVLPSFTGFFDGFTVFHKVGPGFFTFSSTRFGFLRVLPSFLLRVSPIGLTVPHKLNGSNFDFPRVVPDFPGCLTGFIVPHQVE